MVNSHILTKVWNDCLKSENFPDILKFADITRVFEKGNTTDKNDYRSISTLPNFPKNIWKIDWFIDLNFQNI